MKKVKQIVSICITILIAEREGGVNVCFIETSKGNLPIMVTFSILLNHLCFSN